MSANYLPFAPGETSTSAALAGDLGKVWFVGAKAWRLVKAAAALTTMGRATVVSAVSAGAKTWSCNTTTTANSWLVAGVCSSDQVDIASGGYFLVQVSGPAEIVSAAAIADGGLIGTSTTAKKCDDATVAAGVGAFGVALEAAAGADESTGIEIKGLL